MNSCDSLSDYTEDDFVCISQDCILSVDTDNEYVKNFCSALTNHLLRYRNKNPKHILKLAHSFDFSTFGDIEHFNAHITMDDTLKVSFVHNGIVFLVEFYPPRVNSIIKFSSCLDN